MRTETGTRAAPAAPVAALPEPLQPVMSRIDSGILSRCREAIVALNGLSSYGRFVHSGAHVDIAAPRSQEPFQPWESPILRAVKVKTHLSFTTPTAEQIAEVKRAEQARQVAVQKPQHVEPWMEERQARREPAEEKVAKTPSTPASPQVNEVDDMRKRLEAALAENGKLLQQLSSRLNVVKAEVSTQTTPEEYICAVCRQNKVPVIIGARPSPVKVPPKLPPVPPPEKVLAYGMPTDIHSYQPIGDRIFEQLLRYYGQNIPLTAGTRFCYQQATLKQLHLDLTRSRAVAQYAAIMAGTNDFLTNLNAPIYNYFTGLLNYVRKQCKKVLVITVPPIPQLMEDSRYLSVVGKINKCLSSPRSPKMVVCDVYSRFFVVGTNILNMDLFETDGIHPNAQGFEVIFSTIEETLKNRRGFS